MQQPFGTLRRSSMLKVAGIGVLILVMLIPMSMTRGVVQDRQHMSAIAHQDIMTSWGQRQTLGGPVLAVPYRLPGGASYGSHSDRKGTVYILPTLLDVQVNLDDEILSRGIHDVPVYTAEAHIRGEFGPPDMSGLGIDHAVFDWDGAYFALPVTDARAIRNSPAIQIGGAQLNFEAGGHRIAGLPPQITALAGALYADGLPDDRLTFSIDLNFGGTDSLNFLPLGDLTTVRTQSSWSAPSFSGTYLPETRTVTDSGFDATWRVASLGRALPSRWTSEQSIHAANGLASFGVDLFQPVGIYQMTDRATKYAVLFIGLTFVAFFLYEVLGNFRLHPLQYLLVGFANTLFFLLLLSLAEHIGFALSYVLSAVASTALVGAYSSVILAGWQRALLIIAMLIALYGFLYLTLQAETFAMLAGALGLWFSLGLIMYLTRGIDWYNWGSGAGANNDQEDLFAGSRT